MKDTLTSGNCNIGPRDLGGQSRPRIVECDHGIKGIFKAKNIPYPYQEVTAERESANPLGTFDSYQVSDVNAELAAYAMDQLFELRVIPIVVARTFSSLGLGSLQYFVRNGHEGMGEMATPGFRRMKILDFIINNEDRWIANWLFLSGSNRIAAIDQGRSFFDVDNPVNPIFSLNEVLSQLEHEPSLGLRLQSVTDEEIFNALKVYIPLANIQSVQSRVHQIQNELSNTNLD